MQKTDGTEKGGKIQKKERRCKRTIQLLIDMKCETQKGCRVQKQRKEKKNQGGKLKEGALTTNKTGTKEPGTATIPSQGKKKSVQSGSLMHKKVEVKSPLYY